MSLATGEQMDSGAIQPDIQTEQEFILASEDNRPLVFAEPRGDFDVLPNAITTGAELEDSPGAEQDEHLNDKLDVTIQVSGQEDATVEVTNDQQDAESPDDTDSGKSDAGVPEPAQPEALVRGH